jgi:hypothetical protein
VRGNPNPPFLPTVPQGETGELGGWRSRPAWECQISSGMIDVYVCSRLTTPNFGHVVLNQTVEGLFDAANPATNLNIS